MAEPFKHRIDAALVATAARHLRRAWRAFPAERFRRLATDGLGDLELKTRARHVAQALAATLPDDFARACDVLEASLAPARLDDALDVLVTTDAGLAGWIVWPMGELVAQRGLEHPERALAALHALTQRWTAEYAIRPFLVAHEALALRTLRAWVGDPSPHVRRLVSEGSRPRLPWGLVLRRFVADPSPTLPLLAALQDDASAYVRRSVANHLNDVAKDHPRVVADWLARHLPHAPAPRRALLRHASRTLIKRGDRAVLAAWGAGAPLRGDATLAIAPGRVRVGDAIELRATLRSTARSPQRLVVDYAVQRAVAAGSREATAKVWKGWAVELRAGEQRMLQKRHSLAPVTTRRDRPGRHDVELRVNGRTVARASFVLRA
jgi:3-methyladenine DNA glycosylase AlkC